MSQDDLKLKTKKSLYWSFLNQFANYGIQFAIGIVMARLLSPADYGITALPAVFMAVAGIFVDGGGFGSALVRKPEITEKDLATSFYYSIVVGLFCYLSLFFASPWIAAFYNAPILKDIMKVTAIGFLIGPLNIPQTIILKRRLDFKTPTKVNITCRILSGIVGLTLAFIGYGVWALVLSSLFSSIVSLILNWWVVRWYPKTGWSKESFKYLWNYGNKMMGAQLLNTLYNNITPVIIGKFFSPALLGVYNRAQGYAALPSNNISGAISSVTFPVISKIQDDPERLERAYRKMLRTAAFIIFPLMMVLSALARPLIIVMITEKWEACILLLQIICFNKMWWPIHAMNVNLLLVKGRTDLFLRLEIIKKILGLCILCSTLPFGIVAFCVGGVISSVICLFINTYYTGKLINVGFWVQMKDIIPSFTLSLCIWLLLQGACLLIDNYVIQIIVGGILALTFYLGMSILLKRPELQEVKYMLDRKRKY